MTEPCRHERDYTTAQAMKSYIDAAKIAGDAAIERDKALAEVKRLHDLCETVIEVHANVVMDTPEDVALHDEAIRTFRACLVGTPAALAALDTP